MTGRDKGIEVVQVTATEGEEGEEEAAAAAAADEDDDGFLFFDMMSADERC